MTIKRQGKIYTHLWYAKGAEEAARLYTSIFPDSKVDRVSTMQSESPSGPPGSVKVVDFTLLGQRFQAMTAGPHHDFNDAISIVVECEDQAELDRYWDALLKDGGIGTWEALAAAPVERIKEILDAAGPRYQIHDPSTWPAQAKFAANGQWDELKEYQEMLIGGRTDADA